MTASRANPTGLRPGRGLPGFARSLSIPAQIVSRAPIIRIST